MPLPEYTGSSRMPSFAASSLTAAIIDFGRQSIALADIVAIGDDMLALDHAGETHEGSGLLRQRKDVGFLLFLRRAYTDAEHRNAAVEGGQASNKTSLRAGAAGRVYEGVDAQANVVCLGQKLDSAIDVAERADWVRATAGNDVRTMPLLPAGRRR